jgi:hypothetical protein
MLRTAKRAICCENCDDTLVRINLSRSSCSAAVSHFWYSASSSRPRKVAAHCRYRSRNCPTCSVGFIDPIRPSSFKKRRYTRSVEAPRGAQGTKANAEGAPTTFSQYFVHMIREPDAMLRFDRRTAFDPKPRRHLGRGDPLLVGQLGRHESFLTFKQGFLVVAYGGHRPGAGRPKGTKNKRTLLAEEAIAKAVETIEAELNGEVITLEQAASMSALDVLKHKLSFAAHAVSVGMCSIPPAWPIRRVSCASVSGVMLPRSRSARNSARWTMTSPRSALSVPPMHHQLQQRRCVLATPRCPPIQEYATRRSEQGTAQQGRAALDERK